MFSKILVCLDGSEFSERAMHQAIDLIKCFNAKLLAVHVIPRQTYAFAASEAGLAAVAVISKDLRSEGEKILKHARELADQVGISINTQLVEGIPAEQILGLAEREKVDLIVLGSRGLTAVKAFFLGSISDSVSHHAKCPVLIVK
jgi:nucleotide-binding universal stress UspA family protein